MVNGPFQIKRDILSDIAAIRKEVYVATIGGLAGKTNLPELPQAANMPARL